MFHESGRTLQIRELKSSDHDQEMRDSLKDLLKNFCGRIAFTGSHRLKSSAISLRWSNSFAFRLRASAEQQMGAVDALCLGVLLFQKPSFVIRDGITAFIL
jgi:hypothetical protein